MSVPYRLVLVLLLAWGSPAFAADPVKEQAERIKRNAKDAFEQRERESAIRALGKLGGPKAAAVLVPLFDDPFVHLRDHATSGWISMLKGGQGDATRTWLQDKALRNRSAAVRAGAWTALAIVSKSNTQTVFAERITKEKDPDVLRAWARAALRLPATEAIAPVALARVKALKEDPAQWDLAEAAGYHGAAGDAQPLPALLGHKSPWARAGAIHALGAQGRCPQGLFDVAAKDKAPVVRVALAHGLGASSAAGPWPVTAHVAWEVLLADDDWRVRAAAINAGLLRWSNDIVRPLIERLGQESGRLQEDLQRALETFTGADIAADADLWRAWWQAKKDTFDAGERPRLEGQRVPYRDGAERPGEEEGTVAFFDLPLHSKRLLFVFDLSGSIRNAAHDGPDAPTKLELIQQEMAKTLKALPADTSFDLLVYRYPSGFPPKPKHTRAFGKLQPAKAGNVKKALSWLGKQEAKGWGAFIEPLEKAIEDEVIDTAVLLSDGRPSRGRYDRDFRILQEFPQLNRLGQLAVHTVLIGSKGADRKFMQRLAALTGGRFRSAGGR